MAPPLKTHCKRGHKFVPGSFRMVKLSSGYKVRQCKRCRSLLDSARYHANPKRQAAIRARANLRSALR